jgi:hypothetical protein
VAKELILSNGKVALVDDCDFLACLKYWPWTCTNGYARATVDGRRASLTYIYLHQLITQRMGLVGQPDHIDRNRLNNQRGNLRPATQSQNVANIGLRSDNTSGFKGVSWCSQLRKWVARITVGDQYLCVGSFDSKIEAARAYNAAAIRYRGEFAYLNPV